MNALWELAIAVALNAVLGGFAWFEVLHPKRLLVMLTRFLEGVLRERMGFELKTAGALLTILVALAAALAAGLLSGLGSAARVALLFWLFSPARLASQLKKVWRQLTRHDLTMARARIGELVRRDTDQMNEQDVACAAVEHVSRHLGDLVVGPLLFAALGCLLDCAPLVGWIYVAIGTLDDTVGFRDDLYVDLGRFAAWLDDKLGLIPARLAAWLVVAAAGLTGMDAPGALRVMDRDHATQLSPNGGWPMAATAGALGIRLGGDMRLGGVVIHRRALGDARRAPEAEDVKRALLLMWCVYAMAFLALLPALLLLL